MRVSHVKQIHNAPLLFHALKQDFGKQAGMPWMLKKPLFAEEL